MATFNATFVTEEIAFNATLSVASVELDASWGDVMIIDKTYPDFDGEYDVIPKTTQQVLGTKDKHTTDDITIEAIPYSEVSNLHGTTITIAS